MMKINFGACALSPNNRNILLHVLMVKILILDGTMRVFSSKLKKQVSVHTFYKKNMNIQSSYLEDKYKGR
jgi:hypothetical protein